MNLMFTYSQWLIVGYKQVISIHVFHIEEIRAVALVCVICNGAQSELLPCNMPVSASCRICPLRPTRNSQCLQYPRCVQPCPPSHPVNTVALHAPLLPPFVSYPLASHLHSPQHSFSLPLSPYSHPRSPNSASPPFLASLPSTPCSWMVVVG